MTKLREMEKRFKDGRKGWLVQNFRRMERRLPVRSLYWIFGGHAFVRAALRRHFDSLTLPPCLAAGKPGHVLKLSRRQHYLNELLEYVPERLAEPKWMNRCRIEGLDLLVQARQNRRPVVLAFVHSGAFRLSRFWLRAAGFPAAALAAGQPGKKKKWERPEGALLPFPEIPTIFYLNQLRAASEFLAAGNPLLVAIDYGTEKQVNVPVGGGWTFQMAAGAVRLAIHHQAELIPFLLIDEGRWRFQIRLGRPVPAEYLAAGVDWVHAGKHLLDEMLPHFRNHPRECSHMMIRCFRAPIPAAPDGPDAS